MANSKVFKKVLTLTTTFMLFVVLLIGTTGCTGTVEPTTQPKRTIGNEGKPVIQALPTINGSDTIVVVDPKTTKNMAGTANLSNASKSKSDLIMLVSLQGIVAQTKAEIYIGSEDDTLLKYMKEKYNKKTEVVDNMTDLLNRYKSQIADSGYVKLKYTATGMSTNNMNQASTIAAAKKWLVVPCLKDKDDVLENAVKAAGFTMKDDLFYGEHSTDNEYKTFNNYKSGVSTEVLSAIHPTSVKSRDYGIATKSAFYFYRTDTTATSELLSVYGSLNPLATVIGWEDVVANGAQSGENTQEWIKKASYHGVVAMPTSEVYNLSLYASVKQEAQLKQKDSKKNAADGVHIATVIYNNGENVGDFINFLDDNKMFANTDKATNPVGWTMSPSLFSLAPAAISYAFDNMTDNEHFVASVSGFAPANLTELAGHNDNKTLNAYFSRTNDLMGKAGLQYVSYQGNIKDTKILDEYGKLSNVKGGFILSDNYATPTGGVRWVGDKPFIADREVLRENMYASPDQDKTAATKIDQIAAKIAERLGQYKTDKSNLESYSVVQVYSSYAYSKAVSKLYGGVDATKVKFVTPDEFIKLIQANVAKNNVDKVEVGSLKK